MEDKAYANNAYHIVNHVLDQLTTVNHAKA